MYLRDNFVLSRWGQRPRHFHRKLPQSTTRSIVSRQMNVEKIGELHFIHMFNILLYYQESRPLLGSTLLALNMGVRSVTDGQRLAQ